MNNNPRREERKLIFGTLLALFLIGFVLVYGVLTRQSYTDKERQRHAENDCAGTHGHAGGKRPDILALLG